MTTINNLSIEQMREIVDGAPEGEVYCHFYDPEFHYFAKTSEYFDDAAMIFEDGGWIGVDDGYPHNGRLDKAPYILIDDLRTAIAKHDSPEFKVGDLVVFTDIQNSCLVTFEGKESFPIEMYSISYPDGTTGQIYYLNKIRHATPEEIKAGHRLEAERHG